MVALKKYDRIEATGLWRAEPDAQRREVIVVLGDATLTLKDTNDTALAHWSIAAIARTNPGQRPARFHPDGDPGEELELPIAEAEMIDAIETLRRAVERARPHPGRLRWIGFTLSTAAVLAALVFWLPGALISHTLNVVPDVARQQIGADLLRRMTRVVGPTCATSASSSSLARLGARLEAPQLAVLRTDQPAALHLPGGLIAVSRGPFEDYEGPEVAAGFILAQKVAAQQTDPLRPLLDHVGLRHTFRLLTTGRLNAKALDLYSEHLMTRAPVSPPTDQLLAKFAQAQTSSTPYAYALDITGESTLALIEGDPMRPKQATALLKDQDWLQLQTICQR